MEGGCIAAAGAEFKPVNQAQRCQSVGFG